MTATACKHCGAETSNGLVLCDLCRKAAATYLEYLPVYFRNLARWRPGRAGARQVPGSREPRSDAPKAADNRIQRALDAAEVDLVGWVRCLHDDRAVEIPERTSEEDWVEAACQLLTEHLTSIATLEWAGEFVRQASRYERMLRALTESAVPGWYAGKCRRCQTETFVIPGLTWVTCGGCGATTYARDHLNTVLDEARVWVARPLRIAEAIVALVDTEMSVPKLYERIKKWEQRGDLTGIRDVDEDGDPVGAKRYRMGEVLDRIFRNGATRTEAVSAAS